MEFRDVAGLREIGYGNYRVIYRYANRVVTILTVRHAARQLGEESPAQE